MAAVLPDRLTAGGGWLTLRYSRRRHAITVAALPGLGPDEVPAILQRGEAVFTPAQLRLLKETIGARGDGRAGAAPAVNLTLNVASSDANGFRAAQGQILAEAGRLIQRHLRRNA